MKNTLRNVAGSSLILLMAATPLAAPLAYAESAGQYVDDATITTKVKAALLADSQLKAIHISVKTTQGTVQLAGTVDTPAQESQAIKDANQVDGVKLVSDAITVRGPQEQ